MVEEPAAEDGFQLILVSCPVHQTDYDKLLIKLNGSILGLLRLSLGTRSDLISKLIL